MQRDLVRDGLRFKLAERYREDPTGFLSLSKEAIDSALGREIVASCGTRATLRKRCAARSGLPRAGSGRFKAIRHPILIGTAHHLCSEPRPDHSGGEPI